MSLCFFDTKWTEMAFDYTTHVNLEGVFTAPQRLICIGDIHGDFELLYTLLTQVTQVIRPLPCTCDTKTMPKKITHRLLSLCDCIESCRFEWCAPASTWIVFLGDLTDRRRDDSTLSYPPDDNIQASPTAQYDGEMAHEECAILDFINFVTVLASKSQGGRCIKLLGNHELMNLDENNNNQDYVTEQALYDTSEGLGYAEGLLGRKQAFGYRGILREKLLLCGCYGIVQIGRGLFMHGGLHEQFTKHPAFASLFPDVERMELLPFVLNSSSNHSTIPLINASLFTWLHSRPLTDPMLQNNIFPVLSTGPKSPFWDRSLSQEDAPLVLRDRWAEILDQTVRANVLEGHTIIVVGHCVQVSRTDTLKTEPSYKFIKNLSQAKEAMFRLGDEAEWCGFEDLEHCKSQYQFKQSNHQADQDHLKIPWSGIQFLVPRDSSQTVIQSHRDRGHIYMCDVAMSRAFDTEKEKQLCCKNLTHTSCHAFHCRAPQVLVFQCDNDWKPELWIAKEHLSRRWLNSNDVHLYVNY